ncbi:29855_t:CDS:1, partial [Gigaspora margarita]
AEVEKNNKNLLLEDSDVLFALTNVYRDGIGVTTKYGILSQNIELQEQE